MSLATSWVRHLLEILEAQEWMDDARCVTYPESMFFRDGRGGGPRFWDRPRQICEACPVRAQCLAWGMDTDDGMFGGTTPEERAAIRAGSAA